MRFPGTARVSTPKRSRSLPAERALSFTGRVRSFSYAIRGLALMLRSQQNAWIHAAATVTVIGAGMLVGLSPSEVEEP